MVTKSLIGNPEAERSFRRPGSGLEFVAQDKDQ
jgi:hypothetical protein